ncbi:MAG: glycosyltransferase family 2 protein [Bacteroidota bacterium]
MPQLTILMPAFDASEYIVEAIDSLLNQTFRDFELWIIDDGSRDNTRHIIESFSDTRVRKFYFEQNRGRVEVINEFVKKISSEFFTITDADDISHPIRLQLQLELLKNDSKLMMCGTSYAAMNDKGFLFRELRLPSDYSEVYAQMPFRCQFLGAATVMRTSVIGYFPEFYRVYFKDNIADADLASRIVDRFKAVNLSVSLYYYRILKTSLSRKCVTVRFLNLYEAVAFLSSERRSNRPDSLMRNEPEVVDKFLASITKKYDEDPSFIFRHAAFTHLYWKLMNEAWRNAFLAWRTKPMRARNYFLLIYIAAKTSLYFFTDRLFTMHYTTHFSKPLAR